MPIISKKNRTSNRFVRFGFLTALIFVNFLYVVKQLKRSLAHAHAFNVHVRV